MSETQDRDLNQVWQSIGQSLTNAFQTLAIFAAFIPKAKPKVKINKRKEHPPPTPAPPPPARENPNITSDLIFVEKARQQGLPDEQIRTQIEQKSTMFATAQQEHGTGQQYLNELMTNASKYKDGKPARAPSLNPQQQPTLSK